jgi:hypothetical protein
MGQRKTVRVFQLIAEDTVEARVLDIRELCVIHWQGVRAHASCTEKTKDGIVTKVRDLTPSGDTS